MFKQFHIASQFNIQFISEAPDTTTSQLVKMYIQGTPQNLPVHFVQKVLLVRMLHTAYLYKYRDRHTDYLYNMYERPVWEEPGQNMDKVEHQGVRPR